MRQLKCAQQELLLEAYLLIWETKQQKHQTIWQQPHKWAQPAKEIRQRQNSQLRNKYIMLLREFIYFNDNNNDFAVDRRYDNKKDSSVVEKSDTRKIRLTLRQINQLRLQAEAHEAESQSELGFIQQMYGTPIEQEAPA
jgi:hypothetical protein